MRIWGASGFRLFVFPLFRSNVFGAVGGLVASPLTGALARVGLLQASHFVAFFKCKNFRGPKIR